MRTMNEMVMVPHTPSNSNNKVVKLPPQRGQIKKKIFKSVGHCLFKKAVNSVRFMIRLKNSMVKNKFCISAKLLQSLTRRFSFGHTTSTHPSHLL
ncbi:hypothetical protein SUGI_0948070 [Cryptomeria japonica]|nr:hypothetical protein SUGI_0948070 [Cryptomeria japonica]